ncbi:hypothetical protein ABT255_17225 [Streptomyces mirabilis]|uniref:hypothetical protein n=1 Tax=Streptomyces mirabilis TaxID=68239 RepID=UPI0022523A91|nr:hypothetical protein [Streptomyces mirabilis]MCX4617978.1 hypothetical protein [Streptomyces mirabilis]
MELSTPAGLESLARSVAEQLGADRTEKDGDTGRVRIVYADGLACGSTSGSPPRPAAPTAATTLPHPAPAAPPCARSTPAYRRLVLDILSTPIRPDILRTAH